MLWFFFLKKVVIDIFFLNKVNVVTLRIGDENKQSSLKKAVRRINERKQAILTVCEHTSVSASSNYSNTNTVTSSCTKHKYFTK